MAVNRVREADHEVTRDDVAELLELIAAFVSALKRSGAGVPDACREPFESGRLGPRHVRVLMTVTLFRELSVSELARRIDLSLATTSLMVGELAREGVVERSEDERDRRRTIVRLHEDYRPMMEAWSAERLGPVGRGLTRLSPTVHAHLLEGLRVLTEEANAAAGG
jgi:DNA-binding MarR family transcriptional regulator